MILVTEEERLELQKQSIINEKSGGTPNLLPILKKGSHKIIIDKFEKEALYSSDGSINGIYQKEILEEFQAKIDSLLKDGWEKYGFGLLPNTIMK